MLGFCGTQVHADTLAACWMERVLNSRVVQPDRAGSEFLEEHLIYHTSFSSTSQHSEQQLCTGALRPGSPRDAQLLRCSGGGMCHGRVVKHAKQGEDYLLR